MVIMEPDTKPARRPHRLPDADYVGRKLVSFTVCERRRSRGLATPAVTGAIRAALESSVAKHHCVVPLYVVMPDHVHLAILGETETSNARKAMDAFKLRTGRWFRDHRPNLGWQRSYWDHIVRSHESANAHLRYLAANPCRAGLAEDIYSWPFTGCIGYDLCDVLHDAFWD